MCLIAFAIELDARVPLLIASNRDEFFDRPTAPLHRWTLPNGMTVVGGRDLRDGGTWLGVNTEGRVAMLTNVRDGAPQAAARSRGEVVSLWLAGELTWPEMLAQLAPGDYGGFNLVAGDVRDGLWAWASNRDPASPHRRDASALHHRPLAPGIYGLSNATLNTDWPKTIRLKQAMRTSIDNGAWTDAADWKTPLQQSLADAQTAPDNELPMTGVDTATERGLSSPFVHLPGQRYGTRSSLLMRAVRDTPEGTTPDWRVDLEEWTHGESPDHRAAWRNDQRQAISLRWPIAGNAQADAPA